MLRREFGEIEKFQKKSGVVRLDLQSHEEAVGARVESIDSGAQQLWLCVSPGFLCDGCVTLGRLLNLSDALNLFLICKIKVICYSRYALSS